MQRSGWFASSLVGSRHDSSLCGALPFVRMSAGNGDEVEMMRLGGDQVDALIACVRRCYGESYPESDFYEANVIRRELDEGRLLGAVGVAGSRVVAHLGMRIPMPGDAVGDTVAGIVDPDYRG